MPDEQPGTASIRSLQAAFETFNELSGSLQASYEALQRRVADLQSQLAEAQRERLAEAGRKAELARRLGALLEALPGAVLMLDGDGIVRELNATATDFLGEPLRDTAWNDVQRRAFAARRDADGGIELHDGRQLSLAQKAMEPGPGRVLLLTDVTEHRKVQELLSRHRRLAAMGEMAAALAHQIRTPLSAALLYASSAARPGIDAERRGPLLDKATRCLHDLEQLVSDMLRFARGASHADGTVAVDALLASVRDATAPLARPGQQVEFETPARPLVLRGNREALAGAIGNLVANALQHAGDDARVRVEARGAGLDVEIRVSDNGPGVPPALREQIFDPFFTSRPDGTGLGLAVVRSVARAHGGDATLEAGTGGARFLLRLPAGSAARRDLAVEAAA